MSLVLPLIDPFPLIVGGHPSEEDRQFPSQFAIKYLDLCACWSNSIELKKKIGSQLLPVALFLSPTRCDIYSENRGIIVQMVYKWIIQLIIRKGKGNKILSFYSICESNGLLKICVPSVFLLWTPFSCPPSGSVHVRRYPTERAHLFRRIN